MNSDQNSFQDRVARIQSRADEAAQNAPRLKKESIWRRLGYPLAFFGAFALGVIAVFITRYIQVQMVGVPGAGEFGVQEIIGVVMASAAGFVISLFLKDRQKEFATACTVGVMATTFSYHNLVWAYPGSFEVIYGEDWVEFVQKITEPSSLYLFGNSIVFS
ncbi:hypothetical protein [Ruegeria sp.]|uniref:hypothetical protein n=1 Tax=Ruegeria sp. TaxID=1879320 RepID=UPI003B5AE2AA